MEASASFAIHSPWARWALFSAVLGFPLGKSSLHEAASLSSEGAAVRENQHAISSELFGKR